MTDEHFVFKIIAFGKLNLQLSCKVLERSYIYKHILVCCWVEICVVECSRRCGRCHHGIATSSWYGTVCHSKVIHCSIPLLTLCPNGSLTRILVTREILRSYESLYDKLVDQSDGFVDRVMHVQLLLLNHNLNLALLFLTCLHLSELAWCFWLFRGTIFVESGSIRRKLSLFTSHSRVWRKLWLLHERS